MPGSLAGKVALVTGGSRGMGKGAALGLAEAGATVYLTARNARELEATAREVTRSGAGKGIAMQCDHRADGDVRAVFRRIEAEQGRLDVLVNNVFPSDLPEGSFWELPFSHWDDLTIVGLRSHFVAGALTIRHGRLVTLYLAASARAPRKYSKMVTCLCAAIAWAERIGCDFDLGGVPMTGDTDEKRLSIAQFKRDFSTSRPVRDSSPARPRHAAPRSSASTSLRR